MPFLAESPRNWPLLRVGVWGRLLGSVLYESLVWLRLGLYRLRLLPVERAPVPVISVGNLTVGGTGKTPVVEFLLRSLAPRSVVVLTRGYGRKSRSTVQRFRAEEQVSLSAERLGDEPFLLAQRHPQVSVYASASRKWSSRLAMVWDAPECLVLDDAFQHLAMARDLNLLLIDAERGLGNRHLLPTGPLREPLSQVRRADALLLTKANLGFAEAHLHQLRRALQFDGPIFRFEYHPEALVRLDGKVEVEVRSGWSKPVFASCGVGQPGGFRKVLEQLGAEVVQLEALKDHQAYEPSRVAALQRAFRQSGAQRWVVTEKDAVKLRAFPELGAEVWVLRMQVVPDPAWEAFFQEFLARHRLLPEGPPGFTSPEERRP